MPYEAIKTIITSIHIPIIVFTSFHHHSPSFLYQC